MHDDPFARAVHRAESAEHARAEQVRHHRRGVVSKWTRAGFRIHFTIYLIISLMLVAIWMTTTPGGFPWPIFPILGWGAGVAAHWSVTRELSGPPAPRAPQADPDPFARAMPNAPAPAPAAAPVAAAPVAPIPTPAPAAGGSTAEELGKLAKLHKSGALTDAEFSAAKAALLGQ